jgi:hypothetical protein
MDTIVPQLDTSKNLVRVGHCAAVTLTQEMLGKTKQKSKLKTMTKRSSKRVVWHLEPDFWLDVFYFLLFSACLPPKRPTAQ